MKQIEKEFIQFLKEKNCYKEFCTNFIEQRSDTTLQLFLEDVDPEDYLQCCFIFNKTEEDVKYWTEKNTLWIHYLDQKTKLPSTWEEYCKTHLQKGYFIDTDSKIGNITSAFVHLYSDNDKNICNSQEIAEAILALQQLLQLRDCYRKGWTPVKNKDVYYIDPRLKLVESTCLGEVFSFPNLKTALLFRDNFQDLFDKLQVLYK